MALITSILQGGTNNHQTTSEEANAYATDFLTEGIVSSFANTSGVSPATGDFAVNAQASPNMTVAVSSGVAYVTATPTGQGSQKLRVRSTASENVTISANSTGSTRYDWVYLSVNATNAANPAVDGTLVTTLVVSRSTSASSDNGTPPTFGYPLAVVTVSNGASSITNGNITDWRNRATTLPNLVGYTLGVGSTLTTSYVTQSSVLGPSTGNKVHIEIGAFVGNGISGLNRLFDIRIQCDGVTVNDLTNIFSLYDSAVQTNQTVNFVFEHTPTAGPHTWTLQMKASINTAVIVVDNFIKVTEQK